MSVKPVATQARRGGFVSVAVLKRAGGDDPIVSLRYTRDDGIHLARVEFRLDELADLEEAIAIARRTAAG